MKKKSSGVLSKIMLILVFFMGICMICNVAYVFQETEEIEGIVSVIIGLIACIGCVFIWRAKFGTPKQQKRLSAIEQRRRDAYDLQNYLPVIRASICNGEQVAGFKDKKTGQFMEVMLIRNDKDLEEFKARYGVDKVAKEY